MSPMLRVSQIEGIARVTAPVPRKFEAVLNEISYIRMDYAVTTPRTKEKKSRSTQGLEESLVESLDWRPSGNLKFLTTVGYDFSEALNSVNSYPPRALDENLRTVHSRVP